MRLDGKRLLVLGASAGIGRTTAIELAREGARVCAAARRLDRLQETVDAAGERAFARVCDVADEGDCQRVVEEAVAEMGGLDGVVYAPGISTFGPIEQITQADWHRVLGTNLIGVSVVLNAAIEALEASHGRFVVLSSITIYDSPPRPGQASYVVSKRALEALIEAWQGEHRQVGFTSIACGDTVSEFGHGADLETVIPIVQRWTELDYMYGRMMDPVSVAEQVVNALASSETIRRIAITPRYPYEDEPAIDGGEAAVAHNRDRAGG
jgi:NAD(P)-dependent dehydrogenase (short-subunit alcohol dehydrogenase family)